MSTPEELRQMLTDTGWKEQIGTAMETTKKNIGIYARITWWDRDDELVLLVEDEWEYDGAGDRVPLSAFLVQEVPSDVATTKLPVPTVRWLLGEVHRLQKLLEHYQIPGMIIRHIPPAVNLPRTQGKQ